MKYLYIIILCIFILCVSVYLFDTKNTQYYANNVNNTNTQYLNTIKKIKKRMKSVKLDVKKDEILHVEYPIRVLNKNINTEKEKLTNQGYIDIELKNNNVKNKYICDATYTNVIYYERPDLKYKTTFDTGNLVRTLVCKGFVDQYNISGNIYPKYATLYQVEQYNKYMNKLNIKDEIVINTNIISKLAQSIDNLSKEYDTTNNKTNITINDIVNKIKKNFETIKSRKSDHDIKLTTIYDSCGLETSKGVTNTYIIIEYEIIIPFTISGTSLKLFMIADYLPENLSDDILFSNDHIDNLSSYHGINIGVHPLFIQKYNKINKLIDEYNNKVNEANVNKLLNDLDSYNNNLSELNTIKSNLDNEQNEYLDAQIFVNINC